MAEQVLARDLERDITGQKDITQYIRYAKVTQVYDSLEVSQRDNYGKVDLVWLDTNDYVNGSVDALKAWYSTRHGCGILALPCVGDIAVCLSQQDGPPVIIGFLAKAQFEAATQADKAGYSQIGYCHPIKSGEILVKSKAQSYIHYKNDGTIHVVAKNGNRHTLVSDNNETLNTEPAYERTDASENNTLVDLVIGDSEDTIGEDAGCDHSVFNLTSGIYDQASIQIQAYEGQSVFSLPVSSGTEIVSVESIRFVEQDEQGSPVTKAMTRTGFQLYTEYSYLPTETENNGATTNPCSLDVNNSSAFVKIDPKLVGEVKDSTSLHITYIVRTNLLAIKANRLGDLFIDARNIVMRSGQSSAYLGLFSDGSVKLGGSSTEIGDRLGGHIVANRAGVEVSAGISSQARVVTVQPDEAYYSLGNNVYFFITDDYPLFVYRSGSKSFDVVFMDEYLNMSDHEKCNIIPHGIATDTAIADFTQERADQLVAKYSLAGRPVIAYRDLKR